MRLFGVDTWLKTPMDRDIIARWTVGAEQGMSYALDLPQPPDPERFTFLALGDTGDSEAAGPRLSPQEAVAREMAQDAALPESKGDAAFIAHTGDVIYMTGEWRLYDRNFRRPYAAFLTPESTVENLTFRLPFLPVPGNHDYYDLGGWAKWLARIPILGAGLRAIAHELFAFTIPEGGSGMGKAYMQAFVDRQADTRAHPLPYRPGERTRLPNRYYRYRIGSADFFALDSNSLDAPPPWNNAGQAQSDAAQRIAALETRARYLDSQLRHYQLQLDRWRSEEKERIAADAPRREAVAAVIKDFSGTLALLRGALERAASCPAPREEATEAVRTAERRWQEAEADFIEAAEAREVARALEALDEASDEVCAALRAVESCLALLPVNEHRAGILAARDALENASQRWSETVTPVPPEQAAVLRKLSEEALDVQREMALERRRLRARPEDYDGQQLQWLEKSLTEAMQERPDGWRIVVLHHPLYSTISNHCERSDVQNARANLLERLSGRVHLVLTGHSHAFEWLRSESLPHAGIFVTGGGGQVSLRPSILEPRRLPRYREYYESLRKHGAVETAMAGREPAADDDEDGLLYHYLRIQVTPEAIFVHPVGVRRLAEGYRREEPMPVFHAPELPASRLYLHPRRLAAVEIRRDQPPRPHWA